MIDTITILYIPPTSQYIQEENLINDDESQHSQSEVHRHDACNVTYSTCWKVPRDSTCISLHGVGSTFESPHEFWGSATNSVWEIDDARSACSDHQSTSWQWHHRTYNSSPLEICTNRSRHLACPQRRFESDLDRYPQSCDWSQREMWDWYHTQHWQETVTTARTRHWDREEASHEENKRDVTWQRRDDVSRRRLVRDWMTRDRCVSTYIRKD